MLPNDCCGVLLTLYSGVLVLAI